MNPRSSFIQTDMETKTRSRFFLCVLLPLLFFSRTHLSSAAETISLGEALSGNRTISSKDGNFELGFFTPGKSQNYYVGIWYKQLPEQTVFWVANRETPISNKSSSELRINQDGNLVLLDQFKRPVWSTNISSIASNSTTAELLDTGNLVLRDGSNSSLLIWQSFDHPTNSWLPGGTVGRSKITGQSERMTPWKNSEDPSPGLFSLEMDPDGSNQFVLMWNRSIIYWKSGTWNGQYFSSMPGMAGDQPYRMTLEETPNRTYATFKFLGSTFTRSVIDPLGQVEQCTLIEASKTWNCFWAMPTSRCEIYSYCGTFSFCTQPNSSMAFCSCLRGFEPGSPNDWNSSIWSGGCKRRTPLQCGGNASVDAKKDRFFVMSIVKLPQNSRSLKTVGSAEECELACLSNCSCTAYVYDNGCSVWNEELINLRQLSDGDAGGQTLHLRLAASEVQDSGRKKAWVPWTIAGAVVGGVAVFGVIILVIWIRRRRQRLSSLTKVQGSLVSFSYKQLQTITNNFSEKLGRGSFGSVFKGSLPDSTLVAVKKLEGLRQGEKQFRAEVSTIGAIQHVNLIRLHGFCSEGNHRMLVYDYMPKGSLDSQLFHKKSETLDWNARYQIALGTARGLDYLHEKCRERIIHCDIKPENVLLDSSFFPKVADFGMAKLVGREFSRVLTSMRGTVGYLAPEWISGVAITPKADVYSYGMMLFEIISGKRNSGHLGDGEPAFFPCWAARKIADGEFLSVLDNRLEGNADMEELGRACRAACWCIQDNEDDRPSMGQVIQILEGVTEVNIPPIPRALKIFIDT